MTIQCIRQGQDQEFDICTLTPVSVHLGQLIFRYAHRVKLKICFPDIGIGLVSDTTYHIIFFRK